MAKRAGKSSTRRARRRRGLQPASPRQGAGTSAPDAAAGPPAETTPAPRPAAPRPTPPATGRLAARNAVAGPSRLSERAIAEYHYVQRDLRNIAVLLVIMGVLLAAAAVAVNVAGIGRA